MDSQLDAEKQVTVVSPGPSLLPQKWKMEYVENFFDERFAFMDSKWLPCGGISLNFISISSVVYCIVSD